MQTCQNITNVIQKCLCFYVCMLCAFTTALHVFAPAFRKVTFSDKVKVSHTSYIHCTYCYTCLTCVFWLFECLVISTWDAVVTCWRLDSEDLHLDFSLGSHDLRLSWHLALVAWQWRLAAWLQSWVSWLETLLTLGTCSLALKTCSLALVLGLMTWDSLDTYRCGLAVKTCSLASV